MVIQYRSPKAGKGKGGEEREEERNREEGI